MPLARILHRPHVSHGALTKLVDHLPLAIATALGCEDPGGQLTPDHIIVKVDELGDPGTSQYDVEVHIDANMFPSRERSKDKRTSCIWSNVRATLDPDDVTDVAVWVRLMPASFCDGSKAG